jgi:hypothetical protein
MGLIRGLFFAAVFEVGAVGFCLALYRLAGVLARHGLEVLIGCAAALAAGALLRK